MWVWDFEAPLDAVQLASEAVMLLRLDAVRRGRFGAFILSPHHSPDTAPQLWIQINGTFAYLHLFDDLTGASAGYQAREMRVPGCADEVRFIQIGEAEDAPGNMMPGYTLCSLADCYRAASEFFRHPASMPRCIDWTPL